MADRNMKQAAERLMFAGLPIIALRENSKRPVDNNWNKDRGSVIKTMGQLQALNGNNIGLALSWCEPQPWAALDVDDVEWTRDYFAEKGLSLDDLLNADGAVIVDSGKANHIKLFFTIPEPMVTHRHNVDGKTRFEFRCADANGGTVQDVMPPSIHPDTGRPYRWAGKGYRAGGVPKPAAMPSELLSLWESLQGQNEKPALTLVDPFEVTVSLDEAIDALRDVPADKLSRDNWAKVGMALKSIDAGDEGLKAFASWSALDLERYDPKELRSQWASFKPDGGITGATILWMKGQASTDAKIPEYGFPLPSSKTDHVSVITSSEHIWKAAQKHEAVFHRGGVPVEFIGDRSMPVDQHRMVSLVEKLAGLEGQEIGTLKTYGNSVKWSSSRLTSQQGQAILKNFDTIMGCLDEIATISRTPILGYDGEILRTGYHRKYKTLVAGGSADDVPLGEAVQSLLELASDFKGAKPSDLSRLMAAFITPAAKPSKIIGGHTPLFFYEADESQAGKGTYAEAVPKIYGERAVSVKQYEGNDRGSVMKQVNVAMIDARNFITLDNFRGSLESKALESLLTGEEESHLADKKYGHDIVVDPTRFNWALTSNGVKTTQDMFNRYCVIKLKKQPMDYRWRYQTKQGFHQHIVDRQPFYLGCVFAIWKEWIAQGRQVTEGHGHNLSAWAGSLDWIVQNVFGLPTLAADVETRTYQVDPNLAFLRELCLVVKQEDRLGEQLSTADIAGLLVDAEVCLPGSGVPFGQQYVSEKDQNLQAGRKMSALLKEDGDSLEVGGFAITRQDAEKGFEFEGFKRLYWFEEVADA